MTRRWPGWAFAVLLLAASAAAQETPAPEPEAADVISTVVVPVVGTVDGANLVHWRTRVQLVNELKQDVTVALKLPTVPDQPAIITTLGPGGVMQFDDVIGEAFGLESAMSPLVVDTLARRSVTVNAVVYGTRGTDTIRPQPIPIDYGAGYYPTRSLQNLSFNEAWRTNIGVVNLSDKEGEFTLALQRIAGRSVAVSRVTLPPWSLWHMPIQSVFPLITSGDHFTVIVETPVRDSFVYASVIENETSAATFVRPTIATSGMQ
jgi:hypothetical protein